MSAKAITTITRADLAKSFKECHRIEDDILRQLRKQKLDERSPAHLVLPALQNVTRPAWCAADAWEYMIGSVGAWARSHGSLEVFHAARTMKNTPPAVTFQRWLEQRHKKAEARDEAKYMFADMDTIGDEDLL